MLRLKLLCCCVVYSANVPLLNAFLFVNYFGKVNLSKVDNLITKFFPEAPIKFGPLETLIFIDSYVQINGLAKNKNQRFDLDKNCVDSIFLT